MRVSRGAAPCVVDDWLARVGATERLALVEPILAVSPSDAEALRVVHHALSVPEARARAALILEQVAEAPKTPQRAGCDRSVVGRVNDAPELAAARSRWLMQLLETKSDAAGGSAAPALRGAEAAPGEEELWRSPNRWRVASTSRVRSSKHTRAPSSEILPAETADSLGRRMVEFHEDGSTMPSVFVHLLERVITLCPAAEWAFNA